MARRPAPLSFADRVNHLFATVRTAGDEEYTNAEVAHVTGISATYIGYLRKGVRGNPSVDTVRALARFFRVRPSYLVDEEPDEASAGPLAEALRNPGISRLAMRAAEADLSPAAIAAIAAMIDEVEKLEQGKRRPTR